MQIHGSCVALEGAGVVLLGPPGSGKSDLALRLLDRGFILVADDRIEIVDLMASPPAPLAGLLEVRGLGVLRLRYCNQAALTLAVELTPDMPRLPEPRRHPTFDLPMIALDPRAASAPQRVELALSCAAGRIAQVAGAFAPLNALS